MITLTRVELLKIRTTRTPLGLLLAAVGMTALIAVLDAARSGGKFLPPLSTSTTMSFIVTITGFGLLMAFVYGDMIASGEFRHETATVTYLGSPKRSRVLVAKSVAGFIAGLVFGAVAAATATAVGMIFAAAKGDSVQVGAGTLTRYGLGAMLGAGLLAILGVGIGSLIRSQLAGVVGIVVWCILLESILSGVFGSAGPYLPFTAASTLGGSRLDGGDIGFYASSISSHSAVFAVAAVLVLGIAVVISAVASLTSVQADIS